MEDELLREKFTNLEKWRDKVSPIIWDNKSKLERVMELLDKLDKAESKRFEQEKSSSRKINILLISVILVPVAAFIINKLLGG